MAVAVTGGIGAGKSEVLRAFARQGAAVASADEIVHRLYERPEVRDAVTARWGGRVLDPRGAVDRSAVARIVFADPAELRWLEALLHPLAVAEQARWRAELAERPDPPELAVVEVPLLYETGAERRFDAVVVVTAPPRVRAGRTAVADAADRERRLLPDAEKARRADFSYVNDGSLAALDAWVACVAGELRARA